MTQRTFHLESSQTDRIAWDEMTRDEARGLFGMDDMAHDRTRPGTEMAALYWSNTEILLEQEILRVDDVAEAEARYLDAFARAWDAERAEHVVRITTGFLAGNLLHDERGLDTDATINAYRAALASAISAAYPSAEVAVLVARQAQGSLPWPLRTHVYYASGDVEVEDGGLSCSDENVASVEAIAAAVFERGDWYVLDEGAGDDAGTRTSG